MLGNMDNPGAAQPSPFCHCYPLPLQMSHLRMTAMLRVSLTLQPGLYTAAMVDIGPPGWAALQHWKAWCRGCRQPCCRASLLWLQKQCLQCCASCQRAPQRRVGLAVFCNPFCSAAAGNPHRPTMQSHLGNQALLLGRATSKLLLEWRVDPRLFWILMLPPAANQKFSICHLFCAR